MNHPMPCSGASAPTPDADQADVIAHWSRGTPRQWIQQRLADDGIERPGWRDVARYDQIHAGGLKAVATLAGLAGLGRGAGVVDLGGGLGGSARWLAGELGCRVVCVDLTRTLVEAGAELTAWVGLDAQVQHLHADASATGLPAGGFDAVWVQHLALHLPEPQALWQEAARLLRPGGVLALHEWTLGSGGEPYHPLPWSRADGTLSHLQTQAALAAGLRAAGFAEAGFVDGSQAAADAYAAQRATLAKLECPDNPVLPADELLTVLANAERSLRKGRCHCVYATARRLGNDAITTAG
ncbi:class I SAM-dependent methyltransferase [Plasticicumulans sp.]|uniref:class I SAM-dependent methyltransferase n=1 Tax=Plasticicumulans sp. TaxID=2307179 RepID=UPI00395D9D03